MGVKPANSPCQLLNTNQYNMTQKELLNIAESEIKRDGCLSKGVRIEIINAAKRGQDFKLIVSTDDSIRITAELRRAGFQGIVSCAKADKPNTRIITITRPQ